MAVLGGEAAFNERGTLYGVGVYPQPLKKPSMPSVLCICRGSVQRGLEIKKLELVFDDLTLGGVLRE